MTVSSGTSFAKHEAEPVRRDRPGARGDPANPADAGTSAVGAHHERPRDNLRHWPRGRGRSGAHRSPASWNAARCCPGRRRGEGPERRARGDEQPRESEDLEEPRAEARQPTIHQRTVLLLHCLKDVRTAGAWLGLSRDCTSTAFAGREQARRIHQCPSVAAHPRWNDFGARRDCRHPWQRTPKIRPISMNEHPVTILYNRTTKVHSIAAVGAVPYASLAAARHAFANGRPVRPEKGPA